jgi:hypothetical protein
MSEALAAYLAEVARGLGGVARLRRRTFLRELESHLLDEAEARGIADEAGMRAMLAEKEPGGLLGREISDKEDDGLRHRQETKILAGGLIGLATGFYMLLLGYPLGVAAAFGLAEGLTVGAGLFLVRRHWVRLKPGYRLGLAVLLGTLLAIPLGFTGHSHFLWARLLYGSFTGYLAERLGQPRSVLGWVADNLAFTVLMFGLVPLCYGVDGLDFIRSLTFKGMLRPVGFQLALQLAVWGALRLHRLLDARWILRTQGQL